MVSVLITTLAWQLRKAAPHLATQRNATLQYLMRQRFSVLLLVVWLGCGDSRLAPSMPHVHLSSHPHRPGGLGDERTGAQIQISDLYADRKFRARVRGDMSNTQHLVDPKASLHSGCHFAIDVVYTWVDSTNQTWQRTEKRYARSATRGTTLDSKARTHACAPRTSRTSRS